MVVGLKFFSKFGPRLLVFPPVLFGFIEGFMKKTVLKSIRCCIRDELFVTLVPA